MKILANTPGNQSRLIRCGLLLPMFFAVACLEQGGNGTNTASPPNPPPTGSINSPPSIQGSPPSAVKVGDAYSFTPTATDSDGDTLEFRIANRPGWASFDSATGEISGVPALGDIGVYQAVQISVTDGRATATLPNFSITVNQVGRGSATLSWLAPTQNTDGSAVTGLAGYNLYYGTSPGNYTDLIRLNNPSISTYVVEDLELDTYYFVVTAYNTAGGESAYSNMATKVVN